MANQLHDPAWLEDVRQAGPNNTYFSDTPDIPELAVQHVGVGEFIMEDDIFTSAFTPGCGAYAGYSWGNFANMTAVRAYAASQHAAAFAYTPSVYHTADANAIDIEPGCASPSDAPAAYKSGIRYFYESANTIHLVTGALQAAGIARSSYKLISAHYSGSHICGPSTCGYPQADATQFTDSYLGRGLDGTLCPANLLGPVTQTLPIGPGATGTLVATVQKLLNKWTRVIHSTVLVVDGMFGANTEAAVKLALIYWHYSAAGVAAGVVDQSLYNHLASPLPSLSYPAPRSLKVLAAGAHSVKVSWAAPAIPPGLSATLSYDMFIRKNNTIIKGYPRSGIHGTEVQEGGLQPNTAYTLALVATGPNGANFNGSKAATVAFKTAA